MPHTCQGCGESFETLSAKRLHQQDDCQGQFDCEDCGFHNVNTAVMEGTVS